jgi:hypothetical protein
VFGGVALFLFQFGRGDITTSQELLQKSLADYLSGDSLTLAVKSVEQSGKYRTFNAVMPYVTSGLFLLNLLVGLIWVWRSPFAFPDSLLVEEPHKATSEENGPRAPAA